MTMYGTTIETAGIESGETHRVGRRLALKLRLVAAAVRRYNIERKTRRALDALGPRELHDIGLSGRCYVARPTIEVPAGLMNRLMAER